MSSTPQSRRFALLAAPLLVLAVSSSCSDDDDDPASSDAGVSSRDEWCAVVGGIDVKFSAADTDGDEFSVRQAAYAEILGDFHDLENGIDYVDEAAREGVLASIAYGSSVAKAFVDAENDEEAGALVEPIFTGDAGSAAPGADWILTNCGIDIDG